MGDLTALSWELIEALRGETPGKWVAISDKEGEIIARADAADTVLAEAKVKGDSDPIVVRVPAGCKRDEQGTPKPPHGVIRAAWTQGKVVPFFGAGASIMGGMPPASTLLDIMKKRAAFPRGGIADLELAKVSSYFEVRAGRPDLHQLLREMLDIDPRLSPGAMHTFLATPTGRQTKLIITTNYDTLIEQALIAAGVSHDVLVYPTDLTGEYQNAALWIEHGQPPHYIEANKVAPTFSRPVIYKMHGSLGATEQWDSFVITEDDYMQFLARMIDQTAIPARIIQYLQSRRLLFLGYGLRDWNLRIVLMNLNRALGGAIGDPRESTVGTGSRRAPSWAIQRNPNDVERALWEMRNVQIFNEDIDEFAKQLMNEG
jgi:hypothetical protein